MSAAEQPLLAIRDLKVGFKVFAGFLRVLEGLNLWVGGEKRVGLVGETGCGKTTTVKSILRVLPSPPAQVHGGSIIYRGQDILTMSSRQIRRLRRTELAAVFQDPLNSLNPVFTIGTQLGDIVRDAAFVGDGHRRLSRREIQRRCVSALEETGMPDPERILRNYPFQLSGGMRQRVCIAEALIKPAQLLLADEPTTNLDVTIQDQILRRLDRLVEEKGLSVLLITHSLGVVMDLAERVQIMYAGDVVEAGPTGALFRDPKHPYTQALFQCVPSLTGRGMGSGIPGRIPNYLDPPPGCRFHPRCEHKMSRCAEEKPELRPVQQGHDVACFLYTKDDNG